MKTKSVRDFFQEKKKDYSLSLITQDKTLNKEIISEFLNRPGLAFTGYFERFSYQRIQVLGETEITYLQSLSDENLYNIVKEVFVYDIPCIIVTKGLSVPSQMEFLANEMNIPILVSRLNTDKLFNSLRNYLNELFADTKTIHGTLVDVYGVGVLLTGKSGIGKSECALDLVERGQRLVTDDVVKIMVLNEVLIGSSTNDYGYYMEVRGVGLIDVAKMFGIQAARKTKRIDVQIELMPWKDNLDYERIGLTDNFVEILGVRIPIIYLPVSPGKNVSVVIEVVALNYILKRYGYDAAKEYTLRLQDDLKRKATLKSEKMDRE